MARKPFNAATGACGTTTYAENLSRANSMAYARKGTRMGNDIAFAIPMAGNVKLAFTKNDEGYGASLLDENGHGWMTIEPCPSAELAFNSIIYNCPLLDEMYGWDVPYEWNLGLDGYGYIQMKE